MASIRVLRSVGRVLWFAVAGACGMALVGMFAGMVTGALVMMVGILIRSGATSNGFLGMGMGALYGALCAIAVGSCSGFVAFGIAGYFACFSAWPHEVFIKAFRLAWHSAFIGVAVGAILGPLNFFLLGRFIPLNLRDPFTGYIFGVIVGFVIGTLYGAIVGARLEIASQKPEQNVPLSTVESGT